MKEAAIGILSNFTFVSAILAMVLSQIIKVFYYRVQEGEWDLWHLVEAGGMPSSHSAGVVALTLGVALEHGLHTALFTACFIFALIVMYDATGVRRAAGKQAEILNRMVDDIYSGEKVNIKKLKEILGHDPVEVLVGGVFAVVVTFAAYYVYFIR